MMTLANQKQKAVLCGILLGLCIQLCSIGVGVQEAQWNKWGVEPAKIQQLCSGLYFVLIAAIGLRLCIVNALLIVRNMGSSSSQANQTPRANLLLDWAVLMGFLLASVVVEILRLILFYDTALVTNAAIKIFLYVSILFFGCCFAVGQEQTEADGERGIVMFHLQEKEWGPVDLVSGSGQEVQRTDASNTVTVTHAAAVFSSPCMTTEAMLLGQYHQDVAQQDTTHDPKESA
ncbi:expressed unknown protein [Seminavis robusta]|uniref:Uncharacterized protein n=1 Tax=Seminavis robusta TaxID=568900 RepID=A0A9N8DDS9_9STRA|nr:expressed unknown protein [Seminavis robusta]|eukprot:Sro48_g028190.1 n/a (232) ;mRNA; r:56804-57499